MAGAGALNLSLLSRGIGEVQTNGHEKVEVFLEPEDYYNFVNSDRYYLPPIKTNFTFTHGSSGLSTRGSREFNEIHLPKTFTTRKGALLLFSEDFALRDKEREAGQQDGASELPTSLSIHTVEDLAKSILSYGDRDPQADTPSVYMKFLHKKRDMKRQIRPGFSAKRYLATWTRNWDDNVLETVISKGYITERSLFHYNLVIPHLRRRLIAEDLSHYPAPYRLMRSMLLSPGSLSGYTFYRAVTEAEDLFEEQRERSAQKKKKKLTMIKVIKTHKDGLQREVSYSSLDRPAQEEVITDLLVKSAVHYALKKQQEYMDESMKELGGEEEDDREMGKISVHTPVPDFNMKEAVESLLDSHRSGTSALEVDFPEVDNVSHSSDYGGSFKGNTIPKHEKTRHKSGNRGWMYEGSEKEYIGSAPIVTIRDGPSPVMTSSLTHLPPIKTKMPLTPILDVSREQTHLPLPPISDALPYVNIEAPTPQHTTLTGIPLQPDGLGQIQPDGLRDGEETGSEWGVSSVEQDYLQKGGEYDQEDKHSIKSHVKSSYAGSDRGVRHRSSQSTQWKGSQQSLKSSRKGSTQSSTEQEPQLLVGQEHLINQEKQQWLDHEHLVNHEHFIDQEQLVDHEHLVDHDHLIDQEQLVDHKQLVDQEHLVDHEHLIDQEQLIDHKHSVDQEHLVDHEHLIDQEQLIDHKHLVDQEHLVDHEHMINHEQLVDHEHLVDREDLVDHEHLVDHEQLVNHEHLVDREGSVETELTLDGERLVDERLVELVKPVDLWSQADSIASSASIAGDQSIKGSVVRAPDGEIVSVGGSIRHDVASQHGGSRTARTDQDRGFGATDESEASDNDPDAWKPASRTDVSRGPSEQKSTSTKEASRKEHGDQASTDDGLGASFRLENLDRSDGELSVRTGTDHDSFLVTPQSKSKPNNTSRMSKLRPDQTHQVTLISEDGERNDKLWMRRASQISFQDGLVEKDEEAYRRAGSEARVSAGKRSGSRNHIEPSKSEFDVCTQTTGVYPSKKGSATRLAAWSVEGGERKNGVDSVGFNDKDNMVGIERSKSVRKSASYDMMRTEMPGSGRSVSRGDKMRTETLSNRVSVSRNDKPSIGSGQSRHLSESGQRKPSGNNMGRLPGSRRESAKSKANSVNHVTRDGGSRRESGKRMVSTPKRSTPGNESVSSGWRTPSPLAKTPEAEEIFEISGDAFHPGQEVTGQDDSGLGEGKSETETDANQLPVSEIRLEKKQTKQSETRSSRASVASDRSEDGNLRVSGSQILTPPHSPVLSLKASQDSVFSKTQSRSASSGSEQVIVDALTGHAQRIAASILSKAESGRDLEADIRQAAELWTLEHPPRIVSRSQSVQEHIHSDAVEEIAQLRANSAAPTAQEYKDLIRQSLTTAVAMAAGKEPEAFPFDAEVSPELLDALANQSLSPDDIEIVKDDEGKNIIRSKSRMLQELGGVKEGHIYISANSGGQQSDRSLKKTISIPSDRASVIDVGEYDVINYAASERSLHKSKAGSSKSGSLGDVADVGDLDSAGKLSHRSVSSSPEPDEFTTAVDKIQPDDKKVTSSSRHVSIAESVKSAKSQASKKSIESKTSDQSKKSKENKESKETKEKKKSILDREEFVVGKVKSSKELEKLYGPPTPPPKTEEKPVSPPKAAEPIAVIQQEEVEPAPAVEMESPKPVEIPPVSVPPEKPAKSKAKATKPKTKPSKLVKKPDVKEPATTKKPEPVQPIPKKEPEPEKKPAVKKPDVKEPATTKKPEPEPEPVQPIPKKELEPEKKPAAKIDVQPPLKKPEIEIPSKPKPPAPIPAVPVPARKVEDNIQTKSLSHALPAIKPRKPGKGKPKAQKPKKEPAPPKKDEKKKAVKKKGKKAKKEEPVEPSKPVTPPPKPSSPTPPPKSKTPPTAVSPDEFLTPASTPDKSDDEMEFIIIREEYSSPEASIVKQKSPSPVQIPSPKSETVSEPPSEDEDTALKSISSKEARAAKRAAAANKRREEVERRRKEREEQTKREKEEMERQEQLKREMEEERRKREEERRLRKQREAEERDKEEQAELDRERRKLLELEREKRQKEEYARKLDEMKKRQAEEDLKRQELQRLRELEDEERRKEEEERMSLMAEQERLEYERKKKEEEERRKIKEEEDKKRREEEAQRALEEARRLAEDMARRQAELELRLKFNRDLQMEAGGLEHTQDITRMFVFSYFELLQWLGLDIPEFELQKLNNL